MGGENLGDFTDLTELQNEVRFKEDQPERKTGLDSKFEMLFEGPYNKIKEKLDNYIVDGSKIVDLGPNVGNLEEYIDVTKKGCQIDCADIDPAAIEIINGKQFNHTEVRATVSDANEYLKNYDGNDVDVVLVNATLHEINDPENQAGYLDNFFEEMNRITGPDGKVIIGDYYYGRDVSNEEVEKFIEYQKATINHADARNKFIMPDLLKHKALEYGFEIVDFSEMPAVSGIDRRYYVLVLNKINEEKNGQEN